MSKWESISDGDRVELGLAQVDIVGHSDLVGSDRALKEAKSIFRDQMVGVARSRNGRLFNWAGDGGSFMFVTGAGEGFDDVVFSAIQMLGSMPAVNEEIATRTDLISSFDVRISCDAGVATYSDDPGRVTGDFINRFLKHERSLGLTNTVSTTERVWKQLTARLRTRFVMFKYALEVESKIYSYGGKERQREVLQSLTNVEHRDRTEQPPEEASCVEIQAFVGDTLADLSQDAYADVIVEGYKNIGGINLLASKNGLRCDKHVEHGDPEEELSREEYVQLERVLEEFPGRTRQELLRLLSRISPHERQDLLKQLRARDCDPRLLLEELMMRRDLHHGDRWRDPTEPFQGGESLRFYNTAALGYVPLIGDGTLLDHVFARRLVINQVRGGVTEPVVKERLFKFRDGEYVELQPPSSSKGDEDHPKRT